MRCMVKKAGWDLLLYPGRSILVMTALIVGLWGVCSMLVSFVILKHDLTYNYLHTDPAHAVMQSNDFSRLDLHTLRQRPDIASVEFRDLSVQRIEVYPNQWLPLWIYGVENMAQTGLAHIQPEQGPRVPPVGSVLLERNATKIANLRMGSIARIRIGGQLRNLPIAGTCFDAAQAPATQDAFVYVYTDPMTFRDLTGEASARRLIVRFENTHTKADVQRHVDALLQHFAFLGITVSSVSIPPLNQHPHQFQLNTLLTLQASIATLAFLLGAVLVAQLVASILAQQTRQIGILKALGATRWHILAIYLLMLLLLSVASSAVAIPLAIASGFGFAQFVANIINFNIVTTTLPAGLYVTMLGFGLLLPPILALPALRKGGKISVSAALNDHAAYISQPKLAATLYMTRRLPFRLCLACRNVLRRKKRLSLTVLTVALGVAIFCTGFNVRRALEVFLAQNRSTYAYDVQVMLKQQVPRQQALAMFQSLAGVDTLETWSGGRGKLQSAISSTIDTISVTALPYQSRLVRWNLLQGRWLQDITSPEFVLNQTAAEHFGRPLVGASYDLQINGRVQRAMLVGIVREFDIAKIYLDQTFFQQNFSAEQTINSLLVVSSDKSYAAVVALKKQIEAILARSDFNVFAVMSHAERAQMIYNHLDIVLVMLIFLSLLVLVVSALGMAAAMGINVMERTREIGIMRAIGATPGNIVALITVEGMLTSGAGIAIGLLLAWPLSVLASAFFGTLIMGPMVMLENAWSVQGLIITVISTIVFARLASLLPARKALAVSSREALAYA